MSFSYEIYLKVVLGLHVVFCHKENKQYILQECGGGHHGVMDEQYLKLKVVQYQE